MNELAAFFGWFPQHPFLTAAMVLVVIGIFFDAIERDEGMDEAADVADMERRVSAYFDKPEAIANRVHAQMVEDGLFRDRNSHTRLGDKAA